MTVVQISTQDVRRLFLEAQGFIGAPDRRGGVAAMLRAVGAVQLDTISVLARSHELVPYARLGPLSREEIERAYWKRDEAFEYWAHAACVLPIESWPYFEYRRRRARERYASNGYKKAGKEALARLKGEGPLTATELGGAKRGGVWWDWSDTKEALEIMLAEGHVVCVERRGWRRVYDLAERTIPAELLDHTPDDLECWAHLLRAGGKRLGVGTRADLSDYFRLKAIDFRAAVEAAGLVPVEVKGWKDVAWAHPDALTWLEDGIRGRHRTTLLSPFDSLVWDRDRTFRIFDFHHRLEAYVPKPKRIHGYFAMPLLAKGKLVGRVDPSRRDGALVANKLTVERRHVTDMAGALIEAASWVGATSVVVERMDPEDLRAELEAALAPGS
ncbi:MAG: winged helix-turn-helix domain-containing protein [Actinomycetota bacterium]